MGGCETLQQLFRILPATVRHPRAKLSVNAGFSCPNRDGTVSTGGCTFCNNSAFSPSYCTPQKNVRQQLEEGIEFHRRRYRTAEKYLAYFQSFSNTYASLERLETVFSQAFEVPQVAGIIVGTRRTASTNANSTTSPGSPNPATS